MAPYFASTAGQTESYVMFITRPGQLDIQLLFSPLAYLTFWTKPSNSWILQWSPCPLSKCHTSTVSSSYNPPLLHPSNPAHFELSSAPGLDPITSNCWIIQSPPKLLQLTIGILPWGDGKSAKSFQSRTTIAMNRDDIPSQTYPTT